MTPVGPSSNNSIQLPGLRGTADAAWLADVSGREVGTGVKGREGGGDGSGRDT